MGVAGLPQTRQARSLESQPATDISDRSNSDPVMKNNSHSHPTRPNKEAPIARYQIYTQSRIGTFVPGFKTESAGEAVGAFLKQTPAFDGGEIRLWNHRTQELSASVMWQQEKNGFGLSRLHRSSLFHDRLLGVIARQIQANETLHADMRETAGVTMAV